MSDASPSRRSRSGSLIPGVVLIGIGLIFLVQAYLGLEIHNWWALFILIPVFFMLESTYTNLLAGRNAEAIGSLVGALALLALVAIFLFDLPFDQLWPIFLIVAGVALLLRRSMRS